MTTAPKLEPWPYPGFTLDQIDEAVLSNDNISVALTDAILEATKRARAAPSAGLREEEEKAMQEEKYGGKTLVELRALCDAASALPWRVTANAYQFQTIGNDEGRKIAEVSAQPEYRHTRYGDDTNTKFILAACNALPDLIRALTLSKERAGSLRADDGAPPKA